VDYALLAVYFAFVLGIGYLARRSVSTSLDFFLSGRALPAWVTGLAFIAANLGAIEIIGMSANGAQYGMPTMHYFWIGAVPAMLFLGVVMMPFYYGSKVRSVPEFMLRRFGRAAHLVNGISFAVAQILIAGINLYLLASIVNALLGWPLWVSVLLAAAIVLSYTALGGLSAAIYNEVLQFFVIVAAFLPLTVLGLIKVGGIGGLVDKVTASPGGAEQLSAWPGNELTGFSSNFLSVLGLVFGLGFVLSFGYWTTNFVEVQRAMASKSMSAAQRTPIIGAFPKLFVPFIVVIPGMIAAVTIPELASFKATGQGDVDYNDAILLMMRDLLPNGILGVALGEPELVQHRVHLRHLAELHRPQPPGRLLPADGSVGHGRCHRRRSRHRVHRRRLREPDGLPAAAVLVLQRAAVRHVHPRYLLEAHDARGRLVRPGAGHGGRGDRVQPQRGGRAGPARPGGQLPRRRRRVRGRRPGERGGQHGHPAETRKRTGRPGLLAHPAGEPARLHQR
jgi:SSS family transporter